MGDIVVGDIIYSISQATVQMGKDWMGTVLKERTYHAERYVETSLDGFIGKYIVCYGVLFCYSFSTDLQAPTPYTP